MATPQPQHQVPDWETSTTKPSSQRGFLNRLSLLSTTPHNNKSSPSEHKESAIELDSRDNNTIVAPANQTFKDRLPPKLRSFIANRKLLYSAIAALLLLILIIGLAAGLTTKKKASRNLPLPTTPGGPYNGDLTYYSPGPGYGACGWEHTSNDAICAVSHLVWDAVSTSTNPNHNPLCGKKLRITRYDPKQGRNNSVDVEVVDRCTGCKETDIDLSLRMFEVLADEEQGRVVGTWNWLDR